MVIEPAVELARGMIVLAAGPGEFSSKPRPFVVVQSDAFNAVHLSVSLCPMTSVAGGNHLFRVTLPPTRDTGLDRDSEIQIDKIQSLRRERIVRTLGVVPAIVMTRVDDALRRWLQL